MLCFLIDELCKQADKVHNDPDEQALWLNRARGVFERNQLEQHSELLKPAVKSMLEEVTFDA